MLSEQIKTILYGKVLIVQRPEIIFTALAWPCRDQKKKKKTTSAQPGGGAHDGCMPSTQEWRRKLFFSPLHTSFDGKAVAH